MVLYQRKAETVNTAKMKRQQQSITFQTSQLNEGRRQSAAPKLKILEKKHEQLKKKHGLSFG